MLINVYDLKEYSKLFLEMKVMIIIYSIHVSLTIFIKHEYKNSACYFKNRISNNININTILHIKPKTQFVVF